MPTGGVVYATGDEPIKTIIDLQDRTVAVLEGDIYAAVAIDGIKALAESFGIEPIFVEVDSYSEVFRLIDDKQVDARVVNRMFGQSNQSEYDVKKTPIIFRPVGLQFAFPQNADLAPHLIDRIDYHIGTLKDDAQSIYYQSLEKYLAGSVGQDKHDKSSGWIIAAVLGAIGLIAVIAVVIIVMKRIIRSKTEELRIANQRLQQRISEKESSGEMLS